MTTKVHVVNLGPDKVVVSKVNPKTNEVILTPVELYPSDSANEYVYDTQSVVVREEPILPKV
jgi:hypothetical protein